MTVGGRRFLAASVCVVGTIAAAAAGPCQAQPSTPASVKLPVVYSTTPMTRNADLMLSASILSASASEAGLAKVSPSLFRSTRKAARAARAAKLVLFDVPVVFYFVGLNHEWGHQTRATEYGMDSELLFTGTPWSPKPFELYALEQMSDHPLAVPSVHGGGMTASRVLKDRAETIMLRSDRAAPGSALAAIISSLDTPAYAQANLYSGRFTEEWQPGDVSTYVRDWYDRQPRPGQTSLDDVRSHIRTRSALNLLDAALWSETIGLLSDYVWRGETDVRMRWLKVGGVGLLPSVRYEFSPLGPEYYVRTHYRALGAVGTAYGRWTERIGEDRQIGGGLSLSRWSTPRLVPSVTIDVWSQTEEGSGFRGEVAADFERWPARRAALTVAVGAKSSGYLLGFPLARGAYINAGVTLTVW